MVADFRKSDATHRTTVDETGDFKICFDNTLSRFSAKVVYFEVIVEGQDDGNGSDDINRIFAGLDQREKEIYDVKVCRDRSALRE